MLAWSRAARNLEAELSYHLGDDEYVSNEADISKYDKSQDSAYTQAIMGLQGPVARQKQFKISRDI